MSEIPRDPLDINYNNRGVLPHIGLHYRGQLYYQESSYSHFWFAGTMLAAAIAAGFLPWDIETSFGGLKYWIAGAFVWAGICGTAPYWVRNRLGQTIIIDPGNETLTIRSGQSVRVVSWASILELQVCHQRAPGSSVLNGYQLNLAWKDTEGQLQRHCLLKHVNRGCVVSIGNKYASLFGFGLVDCTNDRQAKKTQGPSHM